VVHVGRTEERPGGAANVARNIAALGARVSLLSVAGVDEAGDSLARLLEGERVNVVLHRDGGLDTTIKLRVIGRQQQLLRIDFETQPSHEVLASKLADFERMLSDADVVIMSDYGKGGLTHIARMIELCNAAGKPVLVDPKGDDYERYRNATLLTPNRSEFREVAGGWKSEEELSRKAEQLRRELNLAALLVTRSEEGMSLYREGSILHEPAQAREVFDVSGAGDTVIATLGVMLAAGADLGEAMRMANRAAGIVVGKLGTAVVHREELLQED
jgi:rfaE bifunctional protein kinase chain/domain